MDYVSYISLGVSALGIIICMILHSRLIKIKNAINTEITTRKQQDDKLYYLNETNFKVLSGQKTNVEKKPNYNNFNELLEGENK
jgi:hypothetical protein